MLQPERKLTWDVTGTLCRVEVRSLMSGQWHNMTLNFTRGQWDAWQSGVNIARAFPQLNAGEREFLMSGATPEEWDATFKEDD